MSVKELTREQLIKLKQTFMMELVNNDKYGEFMDVGWNQPSYGELAMVDDLIPDAVIFEKYQNFIFVEEDFFCRCA